MLAAEDLFEVDDRHRHVTSQDYGRLRGGGGYSRSRATKRPRHPTAR